MQPDFLKKKLGQKGEGEASIFLKKQGFKILEKNYRCRLGEIDLIAEKGGELYFVEVKSRRSFSEVSPLELVPRVKQLHISKVAQNYYAAKRIEDRTGHFALVIVDYSGEKAKCEFLSDIFDLSWGY